MWFIGMYITSDNGNLLNCTGRINEGYARITHTYGVPMTSTVTMSAMLYCFVQQIDRHNKFCEDLRSISIVQSA